MAHEHNRKPCRICKRRLSIHNKTGQCFFHTLPKNHGKRRFFDLAGARDNPGLRMVRHDYYGNGEGQWQSVGF